MGLRNRFLFIDKQCFFITTTCNGWKHLFINDNCYKILADSLNFLCSKYKSKILGYVIMANHLHLILYFIDQNRLSDFMRDLKKFTSVQIRKEIEESGNYSLIDKIRFEERDQ